MVHFVTMFISFGQGSPDSVLEGQCPAEFSSNLPQHTCLDVSRITSKTLISWFRCVWLGLRLNSAGHWFCEFMLIQKSTYTWFLMLCSYLNDSQLRFLFSDSCSWVPCLSWTVKLPAFLQKNPSGPTNSLVFQHFCEFEPFPTVTVWFWDPSFHTEDNWGTRMQLLQKVQTLTYAPDGKTMHALRARGWITGLFTITYASRIPSFLLLYVFKWCLVI